MQFPLICCFANRDIRQFGIHHRHITLSGISAIVGNQGGVPRTRVYRFLTVPEHPPASWGYTLLFGVTPPAKPKTLLKTKGGGYPEIAKFENLRKLRGGYPGIASRCKYTWKMFSARFARRKLRGGFHPDMAKSENLRKLRGWLPRFCPTM